MSNILPGSKPQVDPKLEDLAFITQDNKPRNSTLQKIKNLFLGTTNMGTTATTVTGAVAEVNSQLNDLTNENNIFIYVDGTNGIDTNNGLTEITPVKTVKKALNLVPEITSRFYVIKFLNNCSSTDNLEITKNISIDMNNFAFWGNITTKINGYAARMKLNIEIRNGSIHGNITSYANLTISNSTINGNCIFNGAGLCNATRLAKTTVSSSSGYSIVATNTCQLTLEEAIIGGVNGLQAIQESDIRKIKVTNNSTGVQENTTTGGVIR